MKLVDVVREINSLDDELVVFLENLDDFNGEAILVFTKEGDRKEKKINRKSYYYFLEIFIAKEFINDWLATLRYAPLELVKYRINRARETFTDVEFQVAHGKWNTAANRLYCACYYAVTAQLIWNEIYTKTHSGCAKCLPCIS